MLLMFWFLELASSLSAPPLLVFKPKSQLRKGCKEGGSVVSINIANNEEHEREAFGKCH
jgi:hypothetical protein